MPFAGPQLYDREKLQLNLVKLKKSGEEFEIILEDTDTALNYKQNAVAQIDVARVLKAPHIFKDAKKGLRASEARLKELFGTNNELEIAKLIIKEGEYHLTAEQKRDMIEKKRNKIMDHIVMNASDPKTGFPHPRQRIELAMQQAKVNIDPFNSAVAQVDDVIKKLQPIIPLSFKRAHLKITIPNRYAAKAYSTIKSKNELHNEEWHNDGSVSFELIIPAGIKPDILSLVNSLTHGEASIEEGK